VDFARRSLPYSIRVNKRWRLIFFWDGSRGEAASIYLDDHSYL
jgi:proteic killer suppression protein